MGPRPGILDDAEEDLEEKFEEAAPPAARSIQCPECKFESSDGAMVGQHIERHRPMGFPIYSKKGKLISTVCPKGCKRFFNRGQDTLEVSDQGANNLIKELTYHAQNCDGSSRLPTSKEEEQEMAKRTGRSFKRKDKPSEGPKIEPCPVCPNLTFQSGQERGGHFRSAHPGWKTDLRFNRGLASQEQSLLASPPARGDEVTLSLPPTIPMREEAPIKEDRELDPIEDGKRLVVKMRLSATRKRELIKKLEDEADNLEATADAIEKALED